MADGQDTELTYTFKFANEQEKKDFEMAFLGWLKQYQQVATIQNYILSQQEEGISFYANALPGI